MVVLGIAVATIAAVFVFQYGLGYQPCKLCLEQRLPYYFGMPLALMVALAAGSDAGPGRRRLVGLGLLLLAAIFLFGAGLAAYHAGVEWGLWLGPADCGGAGASAAGSMADFMNQLKSVRVVSCTEAAWRFLGLSMAGWNVLVSLLMAAVAAAGAISSFREPGR